ncbi:MAG: hypothetical protein ACW98Y_15115 [Candidatus Thorarchaeota archaeon]|jgi:hypothetical protein
MAWTYVSKSVVAALAKTSIDDLQDEWSNWVEFLITQRQGYEYLGTTTTITEEAHDGDGTPRLFVKKPPIVSVTEVKIGSISPTAITSSSYKVYDHYIELGNTYATSLSGAIDGPLNIFSKGTQNILITYVSGVAIVPQDVEMCAALMLAEVAKYNRKGGSDNTIKFSSQRTQGQSINIFVDKGLVASVLSIRDSLLSIKKYGLG